MTRCKLVFSALLQETRLVIWTKKKLEMARPLWALMLLGVCLWLPAPAAAETVLHAFGPTPDANSPVAPLLLDSEGNLYGTTTTGGNFNRGTVFTIKTDGTGY